MATLMLTFVMLLTVIAAMSVGVIVHGRPIKGSCGGMSAIGMDTACDVCGGDTSKCDTEQEAIKSSSKAAMAYDATKP